MAPAFRNLPEARAALREGMPSEENAELSKQTSAVSSVDYYYGEEYRPSACSGDSTDVEDHSSESNHEVKIDLQLPRRSMLVSFTCNICDGRTERLVNPLAWERGLVIVQCANCLQWHKVADAANLVEEIRFDTDEKT
jgi:hypothetical protein